MIKSINIKSYKSNVSLTDYGEKYVKSTFYLLTYLLTYYESVELSSVRCIGAYNTSIVASSSRMFSRYRYRRLGAKSRSLGSVQSTLSTPAVWFDEPTPPADAVPPPRRGASVRCPSRTPSPLTSLETDQVDRDESEPQPCREPSSPDDQASVPLLPRSVGGRSTSSDAVASSASASLIANCSPDRRSL